ncbi:MAG TPA: hypothetical protein DCS19_01735 [Flavobacterium sp.]|nr:hypothetical protein [Flavobacterium sp.]
MEEIVMTSERNEIAKNNLKRQLRMLKLLEKKFNSWVYIGGEDASAIGAELHSQLNKVIDTIEWLIINPKAELIRYCVTMESKDIFLYRALTENNALRAEIKDLNVKLNYGLQNG